MDEKDARSKEDLQLNTIDNLKVETDVLRRSLDEKLGYNRELNSEVVAYKDILDEKNRDISNIKIDLADEMDESRKSIAQKKLLEDELSMVRESKFLTNEELKKAELTNDRLGNLRGEDIAVIREKDLEIGRMERHNAEAIEEINLLSKEKNAMETELDIARDGRRANQKEVDRMLILNQKLLDENKEREIRMTDLDYDMKRMVRKDADQGFLLDAKDRQLKDARQALGFAEDIGKESKTQLGRVLREKETLEHIADMQKKDALLNKKLRREEMEKNLQLSAEKKRLERNLLDREVEAYTVKKELGQASVFKGNLYDDNMVLENEVSALKSHTGLLMNQNREVYTIYIYIYIFIYSWGENWTE